MVAVFAGFGDMSNLVITINCGHKNNEASEGTRHKKLSATGTAASMSWTDQEARKALGT